MIECVLDTETTGLDPASGDRVVEIGCVELDNLVPTGRTFQVYINPEREVPAGAVAVHGLTTEFLKTKPVFAEVVDSFLDFIGDATLVMHNAEFDRGFLNAELERLGRPPLPIDRVVDTLRIARSRFPGAPASLDALCRRFGIDASERSLHGALLDAQLLAEVYLQLRGGRQPGLALGAARRDGAPETPRAAAAESRTPRAPRPHAPSEAELAAHAAFLEKIKNPIWRA